MTPENQMSFDDNQSPFMVSIVLELTT